MTMGDPVIEYGIFNLLPDGKTLEDIPKKWHWLYTHPFQIGYSDLVLNARVEEMNRTRKKYFDNGKRYYDIGTYCEVRARTVTYSDWRKPAEDNNATS